MDTLWQDIRYGLRMLAKQPAFTAIAVLTLALGIGANTAIFSVMNAVVLRYLPVPNPDRIVYLHTSELGGGQSGYGDSSLPLSAFQALRTQRDVFSDLMAYVPLSFSKVGVRYAAAPEEAEGDMVSGNFFSGLGVKFAAGRGFTIEDENAHAPVAVLSYAYWSGKTGRDPNVLGHAFYIKGVPFTVVGVTAPGFIGVDHGRPTDVWIPLQTRDDLKPWGTSASNSFSLYGTPRWWVLLEIGRLQPGVTQQQALARLNPLYISAIMSAGAVTNDAQKKKPPHLVFTDARGIEGVRDNYQQSLIVLMVMVGLVLVIACGNVGMLMVARNTTRQREFSLRLALGGSAMRLFRQLLTERLMIVFAGSALGWLFALSATQALASWSDLNLDLTPDLTVLLFTIGVSLLAGLAFGLAPLRKAIGTPVGIVLKTATATSNTDRGRARGGKLVVALQMALCLMLLVAAGLLVRTIRNLENVALGVRTQGLFVFGLSPQQHAQTNAEAIVFYRTLIERLRQVPGIDAVTVMSNRIGGGVSSNTGAYVDGVTPGGKDFAAMRWNSVGPDFCKTLGIPLVMGRDILDTDTPDSQKVVIVNQTFATRYLPDQNPLGHRVAFGTDANTPQYVIVGVSADNKYTEVRENARPIAYFPYAQRGSVGSMHVEVHFNGNPFSMMAVVTRAMQEIAPDLPLLQPMTQSAQYNDNLSEERLNARLAMSFGFLAVFLVAIGLYGTLAYRVSRRTNEIGVRMAIGAQRTQVLWMVFKESLLVSVLGIAVGLPLVFFSGKVLSSMLYGVEARDPLSIAAALVGVVIVALVASFIPARRAASVDPMVALRYE